jgi:hypothetical protein
MTQGTVARAGIDQYSGAIRTVQDDGRVGPVDAIAGSCAEKAKAYVCHATAPVARSGFGAGWRIGPEGEGSPQPWMHGEIQEVQA